MEAVIESIENLLPQGFDLTGLLKTAALLMVVSLVLSFLGRMVFGKKSVLNQSVSAAIGILFIYAITVAVHSFGLDLKFLISPLPFVTLSGDYLYVFQYAGAGFPAICEQLLSIVILAFLANLANSLMPQGKNIFTWFLFRCLSILAAILLHSLATYVLQLLLPEGLLKWAPMVLLCLLVLMVGVGALRFLVGAALIVVNPVIAILYTFFFANIVGKQLSKALLTSLILCGIVYGLNAVGWTTVLISVSALLGYLPFLVLLLVIWYICGKLL